MQTVLVQEHSFASRILFDVNETLFNIRALQPELLRFLWGR